VSISGELGGQSGAMTVEEILARLVAFPTVAGHEAIVNWIAWCCQAPGAEVAIIPDLEADRSNRLVIIGPREAGGYFRSGHMDVVPTSEPEWSGASSKESLRISVRTLPRDT
jgi:acetylornithine deacetylase